MNKVTAWEMEHLAAYKAGRGVVTDSCELPLRQALSLVND